MIPPVLLNLVRIHSRGEEVWFQSGPSNVEGFQSRLVFVSGKTKTNNIFNASLVSNRATSNHPEWTSFRVNPVKMNEALRVLWLRFLESILVHNSDVSNLYKNIAYAITELHSGLCKSPVRTIDMNKYVSQLFIHRN